MNKFNMELKEKITELINWYINTYGCSKTKAIKVINNILTSKL